MDAHLPEAERLRRDVEWALSRALDPSDVLPMLHRLARIADDASDEALFAHRNLAELLAERHPWRAALHAKKVLALRPEDERAWATLGLCQTLLGNYQFAVTAYQHALSSSPKNPWYAHNLGHLLDVALGRAKDAVRWLRSAYAGATYNGEIAASYAHALARAGKVAEAKRVLTRAMRRAPSKGSREHSALLRWLEEGAPASSDLLPQAGDQAREADVVVEAPAGGPRLPRTLLQQVQPPARQALNSGNAGNASSASRGRRPNQERAAELVATLERGLESLPLDARQRARANELARDAFDYVCRALSESVDLERRESWLHGLAAAVAYAIVYVDHVPLTQAEVAASFRVSASNLRGRFGELRAHLDLMPGDARYATLLRRR